MKAPAMQSPDLTWRVWKDRLVTHFAGNPPMLISLGVLTATHRKSAMPKPEQSYFAGAARAVAKFCDEHLLRKRDWGDGDRNVSIMDRFGDDWLVLVYAEADQSAHTGVYATSMTGAELRQALKALPKLPDEPENAARAEAAASVLDSLIRDKRAAHHCLQRTYCRPGVELLARLADSALLDGIELALARGQVPVVTIVGDSRRWPNAPFFWPTVVGVAIDRLSNSAVAGSA